MVTRDMVRDDWNYPEKYLVFARKQGSQENYSLLNPIKEPFHGHDDSPGESRTADIALFSEVYVKSLQEYLAREGYETLVFSTDNKGLEHLMTLHLCEALAENIKTEKEVEKEA